MKAIPAHRILGIAALSGMLAVAFGAFGAHALRSQIDPSLMSAYQTGVQYHFYHSLALLMLGLLVRVNGPSFLIGLGAVLFTVGILVFSGSLYLMAVLSLRWLGVLTPFGGLAFIGGWLCLVIAAFRDMKT